MHFIVSWEITSCGKRLEEINNAMLAGIHGYSWIRLLSAFYVLDIEYESDWTVIHEKLLSIAGRFSGEVNFLMSPIYDLDSDFFIYQMPQEGYYKET
jgi:hypothetical protein